jgi:hypothetical protein
MTPKHVGYALMGASMVYAGWSGWAYLGCIWIPTVVGMMMTAY